MERKKTHEKLRKKLRKKTTLYVDPEVWYKMKIKAIRKDKTLTDLLHEIMERETENIRLA